MLTEGMSIERLSFLGSAALDSIVSYFIWQLFKLVKKPPTTTVCMTVPYRLFIKRFTPNFFKKILNQKLVRFNYK